MTEVQTKTMPPSDSQKVITTQPKITEENQKTHKTSNLRKIIINSLTPMNNQIMV